MAIRTVDIFAIGRALGYADAQTRSIESLDIDGSRRQVTVTRFVGDPDTGNKVLPHGVEGKDVSALLADDIFSFTPAGHSVPAVAAENVRMSKAAVEALKRMQW